VVIFDLTCQIFTIVAKLVTTLPCALEVKGIIGKITHIEYLLGDDTKLSWEPNQVIFSYNSKTVENATPAVPPHRGKKIQQVKLACEKLKSEFSAKTLEDSVISSS